jgi:hypothetical protein
MKGYLHFICWCVFAVFDVGICGAQSFEYAVKHQHALKDCSGTLAINSDGVEYRSAHAKDSRKWRFDEIRTLEVKSATEIQVITYEDQKRWAGKDKIFKFVLLDKKASPELSEFLLSRVNRPMELALIPNDKDEPAFVVQVKHLQRITGTLGVLRVYQDRVVFQTANEGDSRYWRIRDIERFSQPDRFRFQIISYVPRAGGPTEVYNFQLMDDLPEGLYDYLWVHLHPSSYYPAIQH